MSPAPVELDHEHYAHYLNQHLLAADAGVKSFKAAQKSWEGTSAEPIFATLHDEIDENRRRLEELIERLGYEVSRTRSLLSGVAEVAGRFNPLNPSRSADSTMSQVELDALVGAIRTQAMMWETLQVLTSIDPRLDPAAIAEMVARCESQRNRVRTVSQETAIARFTVHANPADATVEDAGS